MCVPHGPTHFSTEERVASLMYLTLHHTSYARDNFMTSSGIDVRAPVGMLPNGTEYVSADANMLHAFEVCPDNPEDSYLKL